MKDFDKNLKATLEAREIRPSASSWDQLAKQLEQEEKKSKISFWWMGIAAVFLGGILIGGSIFSNRKAIPTNTPTVVEETPESTIVEPAAISTEPLEVPKQKMMDAPSVATGTNTKKENQTTEQTTRETTQGNRPVKKSLVAISPSGKELIKEQNTEKAELARLEKKLAEAALTTETESLLQEARLQIEKRPFLTHPKNTISAQALLEQVEVDLNRPKRERMFDFVQQKIIQLASKSRVFD